MKKYYYQPKDNEFCEHYFIEEDSVTLAIWANHDASEILGLSPRWVKYKNPAGDELKKFKPDAIELTEKEFTHRLFQVML